jgi:hypothetical protein
MGEQNAGSSIATLTENPTGSRFTLFNTASRMQSTLGWSVRGGVRVYGPLYVEGALGRTSPTLRTTISSDTENATGTPTGELSRTLFSGSLRLDLERLAFAGRKATPFLLAGGGRLRMSQGEFEETGNEFHAGLGLRHRTFGFPRGPVKAIGLRLEGILTWARSGFDFEGQGRRTLSQGDLSLAVWF